MNADRLARWYRVLEYYSFGHALAHTRETYLHDIVDARRVLALGDGDGRALVALLKLALQAHADSHDLSLKMLDLAQRRAAEAGLRDRIVFHHGDILTAALPAREYDVITLHFLLDCLDDAGVEKLAGMLARAIVPDGKLLVSEFRTTRAWHHLVVRALYLGFRWTTGLDVRRLPDYRAILENHGFRRTHTRLRFGGLLAAEFWTH